MNNQIGNIDIIEERRINWIFRGVGTGNQYRNEPANNTGAYMPNKDYQNPAQGQPTLMRRSVNSMTMANKKSIRVPRDSQPVLCPCPASQGCKYLWRCLTFKKDLTPSERLEYATKVGCVFELP